jgi:hypothetical protein
MKTIVEVIIVEKNGNLIPTIIKDFSEENLYKKCGYKKNDNFEKKTSWNTRIKNIQYNISLYAKTIGRATYENKYDFPPPIDNTLFFGNCVLVAKDNETSQYINLSIDLWAKIYDKLFGGFENLADTALEDDNEIDELDTIPKKYKTKTGYLKDGFVVESDSEPEDIEDDEDDDDSDSINTDKECDTNVDDGDLTLEDLGSELSEESYDYDKESEE